MELTLNKAATHAPPRLTWDEAIKLSNGNPFELIDGKMRFKWGDASHADAQTLLGVRLINYLRENPVGIARMEYSLRLWPNNPYEERVPDLCVILNENLKDERYGSAAPDLAIEVVSRDDGWSELHDKAELYFAHGSRIVWFVDPMQKGVMVVTPEDHKWVKDILTCPELLPDFSLNVREIFEWPAVAVKENN